VHCNDNSTSFSVKDPQYVTLSPAAALILRSLTHDPVPEFHPGQAMLITTLCPGACDDSNEVLSSSRAKKTGETCTP